MKTQFVYDYPQMKSTGPTGLVLAYNRTQDERPKPSEIDKIYEKNPVHEINRIIEEELKSTGLFREVIPIPEDQGNAQEYLKGLNVDLLMNADLLEMKWEVPNYETLLQAAFIISFLTGGIGGCIYGSTNTDVYGATQLKIKLIDLASRKSLIDKDYVGRSQEKMAKLKCDTPATKASMVGKSIKNIMQEFKADLAKVVKEIEQQN